MKAHRGHPAWWAFLVHRISGIALSVFLPAHFYVLSLALRGDGRLDRFLSWSRQPLVIAGEWVIVICLAAHLAGGVRLLALEFLPWRNWQKTLAALAAGFAVAAGLAFALAR
jgi:succinate dehydrogenase subunit D